MLEAAVYLLCLVAYAAGLWCHVRAEWDWPKAALTLLAGAAAHRVVGLFGQGLASVGGGHAPLAGEAGLHEAVGSAVVDEVVKAVILLAVRSAVGGFSRPAEGAVAGGLVGVGYAGPAFWVVSAVEDWGAVFRWVSGGLTQGVFTAAAGAALGWADLKVLSAPARSLSAVLGMGASVAGHLAYVGFNFLAWRSGVGGELAAVGLLLLSWSPAALLAGVWVAERRYRRSAAEQYLREEVEAGLLSEGELLVLVRGTRGIPPALRSALLQVALAKWRLVRGRGKEAEVQAWRDRVTALRRGRRVAC